jgi:hypothetical protein
LTAVGPAVAVGIADGAARFKHPPRELVWPTPSPEPVSSEHAVDEKTWVMGLLEPYAGDLVTTDRFARSEYLTTEPTTSGLYIAAPLRFGASNNANNTGQKYLTA